MATTRSLILLMGKPVQGKPEFEYLWHRLRWRFANGEHRDLFTRDPKHYAPQYDGYCALGTSAEEEAHKDTVDPEAWAIVDGKLYLTHNRYLLQVWQENAKEHIRQADQDWEAVKDLPEPEIVGPPCAASPPTTKVALRDGGHWSSSAAKSRATRPAMLWAKAICKRRSNKLARTSLPASMPAARRSRILFLRSAMSHRPVEFNKYADLRQRYFGPPSPKSATVPVPQLDGPDFLVQVGAFAKIQ